MGFAFFRAQADEKNEKIKPFRKKIAQGAAGA